VEQAIEAHRGNEHAEENVNGSEKKIQMANTSLLLPVRNSTNPSVDITITSSLFEVD
jgi:hypothetical protein